MFTASIISLVIGGVLAFVLFMWTAFEVQLPPLFWDAESLRRHQEQAQKSLNGKFALGGTAIFFAVLATVLAFLTAL